MLKAKVTVEVEISQTDELAPDWRESVKEVFANLDSATVRFSDSRGEMKIIDINVVEKDTSS